MAVDFAQHLAEPRVVVAEGGQATAHGLDNAHAA